MLLINRVLDISVLLLTIAFVWSRVCSVSVYPGASLTTRLLYITFRAAAGIEHKLFIAFDEEALDGSERVLEELAQLYLPLDEPGNVELSFYPLLATSLAPSVLFELF